jgi:hypothetical protein
VVRIKEKKTAEKWRRVCRVGEGARIGSASLYARGMQVIAHNTVSREARLRCTLTKNGTINASVLIQRGVPIERTSGQIKTAFSG